MATSKTDLSQFQFEEKIPWEKRLDIIQATFPETLSPNWSGMLKQDPQIMGRLLKDILKAEGQGSKPGKRPNLTQQEAKKNFRRLQGEDYSTRDFYDAFDILTYGRSVRNIANKVNLDRSYVYRLQKREAAPSFTAMESIAAAFGKHPSYFLEYRIASILKAFNTFFTNSPETATHWYTQINKVKK